MKPNFQDVTPDKSLLMGGRSQTTNTILMIEPVAFGFNHQTAVNNYFQQMNFVADADIQQLAFVEFKGMVEKLHANGINVLVVKDTDQPHTPDSIFPNNWISFHEGGQAVLYPMFAENRRKERRRDIIQLIEDQGTVLNNVDDFTFWEEQNLFLEGTGSMVFDRVNKIAYAALSERTDKSVFLQFCIAFDFKPVYFRAFMSVGGNRLPVYHTNVMMTVADKYALICTNSIDDDKELNFVYDVLEKSGKEIIPISRHQMHCFACNMLQVENKEGKLFLVMSQTAFDSLYDHQIEQLKTYNELIVIPIPTIEKVGGGSVRCMMAEVF
jgi:hypothetical protein